MASVSFSSAVGGAAVGARAAARAPRAAAARAAPAAAPRRAAAVCKVGKNNNTLEAGVGIFGTKAGMTTVFSEDGEAIPVSVVMLGEGNVVTSVMTEEKNGYSAVQVGYGAIPEHKLSKAEMGHLEKNGAPALRHLQEFRVKPDVAEQYAVGQQLMPTEMFEAGALVDVKGRTAGKGFAGTIKRHGFSRGPMTHGSKNHRIPGSIGMSATPARVLPGKKMAGKMGNVMAKERKLQVVKVDEELGCMLIRGSTPGKPGGMLRITPAKIVGKNV